MDKLDEYREQIDVIDKEMAKLFEKRMAIVKDIAKVKQEMGLPIYDQSRETFILLRNMSYIADDDARHAYYEILTKMFEESKKMQEKFLHQN